MKKNAYLFISLLLVISLIVTSYLNNSKPEIVDEKSAIKIAWLLLKDNFKPYDVLEAYLKAERKGPNWHIGLDYKQLFQDKVPYDDEPDYEVIIQGKDGKIKSVTSVYGETKQYTHELIDKQLALQIAEVLVNSDSSPVKYQDIIYSIEKIKNNWHINVKSKDKLTNFNCEITINSKNGKIGAMVPRGQFS